jgi:hypothetical protein
MNDLEFARVVVRAITRPSGREEKKDKAILLGFWYCVVFIVGIAIGYFLI